MSNATFNASSAAADEQKGKKNWKGIRAVLRRDATSIDQASCYMLQLYRTNLEVRLYGIDLASLQTDNQKKIYSSVSEILKTTPRASVANLHTEWDEIFKAERLIGLLLSGGQLRQEIGARLQELAGENATDAERLQKEYDALVKSPTDAAAPAANDVVLRSFLLRVMELLHWAAKKKYLARPIRRQATTRILNFVLVCFFLLIAPYIILHFDFAPSGGGTGSVLDVSKIWSLFALYTALTSGMLGAMISRLLTMQRHWADMTLDEVFAFRETYYTFLRAVVGMCGALIVYFFLRSGIVEGALFPVFEQIAIEFVSVPTPGAAVAVHMAFVMPSKDLALLTFWCFLAGFSELLVPGILATTERQLSEASAPAKK